jgi:HAD superfamily hydrolase (TIGR01509 family)
MPISHVIFDFDGVLIDSEQISMVIDRGLLAECGVDLSEAEMHQRFVGKTFERMVHEVEQEFGLKLPEDLEARKDVLMLDLYRRELQPVPGVVAMLEQLHLPRSIGTNGPRARALEALKITGLDRFFGERLTTFEDVANGKPAPDVYLLAASRAGFAPTDCLVIEDSKTGATAALAAGCKVVGFTGVSHHPEQSAEELRAVGVKIIINDHADIISMLRADAA